MKNDVSMQFNLLHFYVFIVFRVWALLWLSHRLHFKYASFVSLCWKKLRGSGCLSCGIKGFPFYYKIKGRNLSLSTGALSRSCWKACHNFCREAVHRHFSFSCLRLMWQLNSWWLWLTCRLASRLDKLQDSSHPVSISLAHAWPLVSPGTSNRQCSLVMCQLDPLTLHTAQPAQSNLRVVPVAFVNVYYLLLTVYFLSEIVILNLFCFFVFFP